MPKLAVSNLAWTGRDDQILPLLSFLGVEGVEVAPAKVAPWEQLSVASMAEFRQRAEGYGLKISSFQAFLFGKPELQLLGDEASFKALCEHMEFVGELAATAGAEVLVFGAPKNRLLLGHTTETAHRLAHNRFSKIADIVVGHGVKLALEAIPAAYGSEFMRSYRESLALAREVAHPGLAFHLDTGCTWVHGDDIAMAINEAGGDISHFHVSQPNLIDFSEPANYQIEAAAALNSACYERWICIEMLETLDPVQSLIDAVNYVSNTYLRQL